MMEAADHGRLDDPALVQALYRSGFRGVLVQGEVGSGTVVVDEITAQQATQVRLVEYDHVVETLPPEGTDETFHVRILPRRSRRCRDFTDADCLGSA